MRIALLFLILACFCVRLQAQQQESRIQNILAPNKNSPSSYQNKSFQGGGSFTGKGTAQTKGFSSMKSFSTKNYLSTSFQAQRYSQGDAHFAAKAADTTGRSEIPNATKSVATPTMQVKDEPDSSKKYASTTYDASTFRGRGKSQDSFDLQSKNGSMTIDQVRELLNKSK